MSQSSGAGRSNSKSDSFDNTYATKDTFYVNLVLENLGV